MIGADYNTVGPHAVNQMPRGLRIVRQRIKVKVPDQIARRAGVIHLGLVTHAVPMHKTPDLVRHEAAAMRQQKLECFAFIQCAAEHQVRHHHGGVEWEADEVVEVIRFHPALGKALVRMGEDKAAQLLGGLQHLAKLVVGQRQALDGGAHLDAFELVFLHHAFQLSDGGIRVLHGQVRQATQPLRVLGHHLRNAIIGELGCFKPRIGRQIVKINRRPHRDARDVQPHAIHQRHFRIGVVKRRFQFSRGTVHIKKCFAVTIFDTGVKALRVIADGVDDGGRDDVVVQVYVHVD